MGGYSLDLFLNQSSIDKEFICSICQDVMKDPVMSQSCEHVFCSSCIAQWTSTTPNGTSNSCPNDRSPITGLRPPFRPFMNMYNSLQLKCTFNGCFTMTDLGSIECHVNSCPHNPEGVQPCVHGCGAAIKMKDLPSHNCIKYLKDEVAKRDQMIQDQKKQVAELKMTEAATAELKKQLSDKDRLFNDVCNDVIKLESLIVDKDIEINEMEREVGKRDEEIFKFHQIMGNLQNINKILRG